MANQNDSCVFPHSHCHVHSRYIYYSKLESSLIISSLIKIVFKNFMRNPKLANIIVRPMYPADNRTISVSFNLRLSADQYIKTPSGNLFNLRLSADQYIKTPSGNLFVRSDVRRGVLPEILTDLLTARKKY